MRSGSEGLTELLCCADCRTILKRLCHGLCTTFVIFSPFQYLLSVYNLVPFFGLAISAFLLSSFIIIYPFN